MTWKEDEKGKTLINLDLVRVVEIMPGGKDGRPWLMRAEGGDILASFEDEEAATYALLQLREELNNNKRHQEVSMYIRGTARDV